jgi:ribonuclease HII
MPTVEELLSQPLSSLKLRFSSQRAKIPSGLLDALDNDPRCGAKELAIRIRISRRQRREELLRLRKLLNYERDLWNQGIDFIAGVDEAGMAPLAGPVVASAVILPKGYRLQGLNDSKKILDAAKRDVMARQIKSDAVCWAVGRAEVEEIDELNIYHAGLLAMRRAVEGLSMQPGFVLVDCRTIPNCSIPQRGIIRGDTLSASIAAASIIAKTTRDAHMAELDCLYPGYGLASHKGYPTSAHFKALNSLGVLPIHRRSFAPVRNALGLEPVQIALFSKEKESSSEETVSKLQVFAR